MTGWLRRHPAATRVAIVAITVLGCWGMLVIGTGSGLEGLEPGEASPIRFVADQPITVEDPDATERERLDAAAEVPQVPEPLPGVEQEVTEGIVGFFQAAQRAVESAAQPSGATTTITAEASTTTEAAADAATAPPQAAGQGQAPGTTVPEATTTTAPATLEVSGTVYLDIDEDGRFNPSGEDRGVGLVTVSVIGGDGRHHSTDTQTDGSFVVSDVAAGRIEASVDLGDTDLPALFAPTGANPRGEATEGSLELDPIGFAPDTASIDDQVEALAAVAPGLPRSTLQIVAELATADVARAALEQPSFLLQVRDRAISDAASVLQDGLSADLLERTRQDLVDTALPIPLDEESNQEAGMAAAQVAATFLQPNRTLDIEATEAARAEAAEAVEPVEVTYVEDQTIVDQGEPLLAVHLAAIDRLGLADVTGPSYWPILAVVAVLVMVEAFYLARFRPEIWRQPKRVALFGVLLVLGAGAARLASELAAGIAGPAAAYVIPVAAFGLMAAILFDGRIAVLMAIALGSFAAVTSADPGITVFAVIAGLAPVPFVSSISTRADVRRAIAYSSVTVGAIAAATAWLFAPEFSDAAVVWNYVWQAAAWATVSTAVTSLVGVAAMGFLEVVFDVTTTPRLLDVTDRNHPALVVLQERAWGTFNHSLMVGTLASAAAKAIGADNLLALAAAYYHDLGKTENPLLFIENQFGISNPHDDLEPEESVRIIRQHVFDGVRLAKRYRIPNEVAEGIVTHHGDGVMRYFYEKAKEHRGAEHVDIDDFRHAGRRPRTREMAILMMADSTEAACRAVFQTEDPSVDGISKVVERVVAEKVDDGQLAECALTLGDLSRVRQAFVEALVGHYHPRIPYPNFPDR